MAFTATSDLKTKWDGSHSYSFAQNTTDIKMKFWCDWGDRFDAKDYLLNSQFSDLSLIPGSGVGGSDISNLLCTAVNIDHKGTADGTGPESAALTTTWIPANTSGGLVKDSDVLGDTDNWDNNITFSGQAMTIPCSGWYWSDATVNGTPMLNDDPASPVKIFPFADINITGKWKSKPPINVLKSTLGHINSTAFLGVAANELLFTGLEQSQNNGNTQYPYALNYHFTWNPTGWNKFWRATDNKTYRVRLIDTDSLPYEHAQFSDLNPNTW